MKRFSEKIKLRYFLSLIILTMTFCSLFSMNSRFQENAFYQTNPMQNAGLGSALESSGSFAIATSTGTPDAPESQSAVFYQKSNGVWSSIALVTPQDNQVFEDYGYSCDIDGNFAVVGAYSKNNKGAVYVYNYNGTTWTNTEVLSRNELSDNDMFGFSVSLHSNRLFIGAPGDDTSTDGEGAVYIYSLSGNNWIYDEKITSPAAGTQFGFALDNYNDYFAVSSNPDDQTDTDYNVFIYHYDSGNWTLQDNISEQTYLFGYSLALSDSRLLVGACGDNPAGPLSGSVYYYERNSTTWTQMDNFFPPAGNSDDFFGSSVDIVGDLAIVGAPGTSNTYNKQGYSCYYEFNNNEWELKRVLAPSTAAIGDHIGNSVAITVDDIFIGCPGYDYQVSNSGSLVQYEIPTFNVDFHSNLRRASIGDTIRFYNGSIGDIVQYEWDFDGDNIIDSNDENPEYVYGVPGNYTVSLTIRNQFEPRTMTKENYIKIRSIWETEQKITSDNPLPEEVFGSDFAFNDDHGIVYSIDYSGVLPRNKVTFLKKLNGTWNQSQDIIIDTSFAGPVDVDIHGDYAVLGSAYDNDHGYCYIFHYDGSVWSLTQSLKAFDDSEFARCGVAVSMSDSLLAVSSEIGRVYLWKLEVDQWVPETYIEPSTGNAVLGFGEDLEFHEGKLFVGAPYMVNSGLSNAGLVYLWEPDSTGWVESQIIAPMEPAEDEYFGSEIKLYGNYMIIGKFRQSSFSGTSGAAFVFFYSNGLWSEQQKILPDRVTVGSMFGRNVDINGSYAIIGASYDSEFSENSGAAFLYKRNGYSWEFYSKINPEDICTRARFGHKVVFNGDEIAVSAPYDNEIGVKAGAVYFYPYEQIPVKNNENELTYTVVKASNYPNPFNPRTTIRFSITEQQNVKVTIYNIKGQKVKTLLNDNLSVGTHEVVWNGEESSGKKTGSGVYFYRISPEHGEPVTKKCIMLK